MDITSDQSKLINKFIQDWFKDKKLELETTFGAGGVVDSTTFLQIAQRLRNKGFEVIPQDDRLSIITPNHIRLSLQGLGVLQQYCKDDVLQGKAFTAMFKDRAFPDSNIDLKEYDIRFKIRREEELSQNDPRVVALIDNWENQKKAFRLIRRWTFQGKGIRIDMSMVRQTRNIPGKGEYAWVTSFLQNNVLQELPRYEVEVELLHDTEHTGTAEKALKALICGVGEVQRAIQKNSLLIRNSVSNSVRAEYQALTSTDRFRGVNPITLEVKNMTNEIDESIPNIRSGFNVTDKADGLRTMGFVNKSGELFLIDMSMKIYRTGLKNSKCANSLVDGEWVTISKHGNAINHYLIFDAYYYDGKSVSSAPFITFQDDLLNKEDKSRYNVMRTWYDNWKDGLEVVAKGITDANRLIIALKSFEFATPNSDAIFKGCSTILDTTRIYNTDGLILTSNSQTIPDKPGVRWNYQFKWKPSKDNTVDFLINYEKDVDVPNIDKITTTIHPSSDSTIQYKTMRLFVGGDKEALLLNPRQTILLQQPLPKEKDSGRYRPILFNPVDFPDTMANTCNVMIEADPETGEEYAMTEDSKEPIQDRSVVEMRYDPTRDAGWRWIPTRIRHDKTERLQQAIAKRGPTKYSGTMNDEGTATSVWNSIHNPVTLSMIRSGNEQPTEDEMKDLLKSRETDISKKYYERKAPEENINLIKGLQDFHNKYIKNDILLKRTLRGGNKNLLDMACGKGGDLFKWLFNRARYVVGIDYAGDNIIDPASGAYKRYIDALMEFGMNRVPKMAFVIGDSSKDIIDGAAGTTPEEGDILRSIFGKYPPEGPIPKYIENVMAGSFRAGADVAACMFAIHYFFETPEKLEGFLKNLSETVKVGGHFIGTCFDGDKLFNLLRTVEKGHSKIGKEGDIPIWTITKDYDKEDLTPDDESIGLGIDVEFISIGATHKEYLVPFELLKKKLAKIGFELLDAKDLKEMGLNSSTNTFDVSYEMAEKLGKKFPMPESVKQFSFLNRWFIFKRVGETAVPKITLEEPVEKKITLLEDVEKVDVEGEEVEGEEEEEEEEEEAVVSETGAKLPPRDKKFSDVEIFRFGTDARQVDIGVKDDKGKKDTNVSRWIGIAAPFPIPDPDDPEIKYPSIEHYLAGMKLKQASNKPALAKELMSTAGKIHQDFAAKRRTEKVKAESPRDFELLAEEATEVRKKMTKTYLNQSRTVVDDTKWIPIKDKVLMDALQYRWEHDKRFRETVEAARNSGKYLLFSTKVAAVASELGGTRSLATSMIEGENKVGRFIMELAGFKF
jgi:SAM-dependent methyltransferase